MASVTALVEQLLAALPGQPEALPDQPEAVPSQPEAVPSQPTTGSESSALHATPTFTPPWAQWVPAGAQRCGYPLTAAVPQSWRAALAWAGIPFYFPQAPEVPPPVPAFILGSALAIGKGEITILDPGYLRALNGVELAPLRGWVRQQWGVRMKLPPGVHLGLWTAGAVLVNPLPDACAGFIYGPGHGQRIAVRIDPGSWKAVWW